jgi:hypothetical protein
MASQIEEILKLPAVNGLPETKLIRPARLAGRPITNDRLVYNFRARGELLFSRQL